MLYYALAFLLVAIVAAVFGFGGIASASAGIAQILFFIFLLLTWAFSAMLAGVEFSAVAPRSGEPIVVNNLLVGQEITGIAAMT